MDNSSNKSGGGTESQSRMDILMDRFEFYRSLAAICFDKLDKEDKIDALFQMTELLKEHKES